MKALGNGLSVLAKVLRRLRDPIDTETRGDDCLISVIDCVVVAVLKVS